ncbi:MULTISPECIES: DUF7003 family protein [Bacillus]|uniref:DUF7003 family protein n=1 Tax=Bacillus TaxID=1386 RepID=UPI00047D87C2|nr:MULTISPECIES: hypothetical protein [Bacillus]MED1219732.1 hypothetical protein [Bacillus paralicheniformis]
MIKSREILSLLDGEFSELNRPIFEWRECNYIGSKCTLMRLNKDDWLLSIQCFQIDDKGPFLSIHAYSNSFSDNYSLIIMDDFSLTTKAGELVTYHESNLDQLSEVAKIEIVETLYCIKANQRNRYQKQTKEGAWENIL